LIVDDNSELRALYSDALERAGFLTTTASNGQQALDDLSTAAHLPRLILLDMIMPILSGEAVLHELSRQPRFRLIPIIACSAIRPPHLPMSIHFLRKPIDPVVLCEKVREILDKL
jgi:CheY-like chemotaxis protein